MSALKHKEPRYFRFVEQYLIDQNATKAAILAGFSAKTAKSMASQMLARPHIKALIQEGMDKRAVRLEISADEVLAEAYRMANSDPADCFDEQSRLLAIRAMPIQIRRAIASIKVVTRTVPGTGRRGEPAEVEYVNEIKFWDKNSANERLFKHLGLFEKDNRQKADVFTQLIEKVRSEHADSSRITPKG